jgi:hypothetical protein
MESRVMIGTVVWVSPIETVDADIRLIARIVEGEDPIATSKKLYDALRTYTAPGSYPIGLDLILNEVEYTLRRTGLLEYVEHVSINNISGNLGMPNNWSMPIINRLYSQLVDSSGNVYRNLDGQFDDGVAI